MCQHIYFDHLKHQFHRGGATAAAAANTEIDCNSKTTDCRAKRMKIWALWVVVDTYHHIYFDRLKHRFYRGGATVGDLSSQLKLTVTRKRLAVERNG